MQNCKGECSDVDVISSQEKQKDVQLPSLGTQGMQHPDLSAALKGLNLMQVNPLSNPHIPPVQLTNLSSLLFYLLGTRLILLI